MFAVASVGHQRIAIMTSIGARGLAVLPKITPVRVSVCRQSFHSGFVASASQKKGKVIIEDLFGDSEVEELIPTNVSSTPSGSGLPSDLTRAHGRKARKLSWDVRFERFNQIIEFVTPRLGRVPAEKTPQVRNSAWVHLVGLAANEEQLRKVVDLFPRWKEGGRVFDDNLSEIFVRRCEELTCPSLALQVYGNYAKYNLRLTLPGGRQLLHALHKDHPIDEIITASALYPVYSLPPITQDLVSCALLISACFQHGSKRSLKVANDLMPSFRTLLTEAAPKIASQTPAEKAVDRTWVWVKTTLGRIEKVVESQEGKRPDWLAVWKSNGSGLRTV